MSCVKKGHIAVRCCYCIVWWKKRNFTERPVMQPQGTFVFGSVSRKILRGALMGALLLCSVGIATALAAPVQLLLPQSTAFSILGHSCGGIQEQAFATGFQPTSGFPLGNVYLQTRCGGSGRGGGYHTTTYAAWVAVTWDFAGKALTWTKLAVAPTVDPHFSATDAYGDTVYNTGTAAYLTVPAPAAPTGVTAVQLGDEFQVAWTPNGVNPSALSSSTLTAAPVSSTALILTTNVGGAVTTGLIGPLQPETTYQIIVVNTTIGGSGVPSAPIFATTTAASVVPSAPTGVTARWGAQGATTATLLASWRAAIPGDSPIDQYEILITGSDGGGTFSQIVSGTSLTASFTVDYIPDWRVTVRAHNAAGWGSWSTSFTLGGL